MELVKVQHLNSGDTKTLLMSLATFIRYPYEYWYEKFENEEFDGIEQFDSDDETDDETDDENDQMEEELYEDNVGAVVIEQTSEVPTFASLETLIELPELNWNEIASPVQNDNHGSSVRATRTCSSILSEVHAELLNETDRFDYVRSLVNEEPLIRMSNANKEIEARRLILRADQVSAISEKEILDEIKKNWTASGETRARKSKKDRVYAINILKKSIYEGIEIQLAHEFMERYGATQTY